MKRALSCPIVFASLMVPLASLKAADVNWNLRGSVGIQQNELSFQDDVVPIDPPFPGNEFTFRDGYTVKDQQTFGGLGLTARIGKFSVDLSGQWSGDGNDNGQQFQGNGQVQAVIPLLNVPNPPTVDLGVNHAYSATFDREELNLNVGYGITDNVTLFIGYKNAESTTRLNLTPIGEIGTFALNFEGDRVADFSYDGAQLGVAAAIPIGRLSGTFSVQAAVVYLDGEFVESFEGRTFLFEPTLGNVDITDALGGVDLGVLANIGGESIGVNVGIAWTGRFTKNLPRLLYTLGLDHSQYEFDTSGNQFGDFAERNTRLRFDLRYRF